MTWYRSCHKLNLFSRGYDISRCLEQDLISLMTVYCIVNYRIDYFTFAFLFFIGAEMFGIF